MRTIIYTLRRSIFSMVLLGLALATPGALVAQHKAPTLEQMLNADATLGTEYWIAIPPNEENPFPVQALEVYVASQYDAQITVFDAATNQLYKRSLKPYEVRTLSDVRGETSWQWEVRNAEAVVRQGIRITSQMPISVYVLNSKVTSSDGYMALPTRAWGKEYLAVSYYDFRETRQWAGGFVVVAGEDQTQVTIQLRGSGGSQATTSGGRELGSAPFTVTLDAGDVYMVKGDGTTRGVFDLTGTRSTSTKPVGLLSFHGRTTMPNLLVNGNGRNHLVEMTPPTSMWGVRYSSMEFARSGTGNTGKGDVFRVIARDANTLWTLKYYDKQTKSLIGQGGGLIADAGGFVDLAQSNAPTILTHGYAVWESDKPIQVVQYSCSASWDRSQAFDPFMVTLSPEEQYVTNTVFQFPTNTAFTKHWLQLMVKANTSSPNLETDLTSIMIDGVPVWNHPAVQGPSLLENRMPDGRYWTLLEFTTSGAAHTITSNGQVLFGGYVYGTGSVDAYGWPLASAASNEQSIDTLRPVITVANSCGRYEGEATELRNIPDPPRQQPEPLDQVETGIALIDTLPGAGNTNYRLTLLTDSSFPRNEPYTRFRYQFDVIDPTKDARCVYFVRDWRGNTTIDSCIYNQERLVADSVQLNFGRTRVNVPAQSTVTMTNQLRTSITIQSIDLRAGTRFSITAGAITQPLVLAPNEKHAVTVTYLADVETENAPNNVDIDTLVVVTTECGGVELVARGMATEPRIDVEDYDVGVVLPSELTCKSGGLRISNTGSDTLVITRITGLAGSNFSLSPGALTALPYIIPPKSWYQVKDVCYRRTDAGVDSIRVEFESNGTGPKPFSIWKASTRTTSVSEDTDVAMTVTHTTEGVHVAWGAGSVSFVRLLSVRGEILATVPVSAEMRSAILPTHHLSYQVAVAVLCDARGAVLQQHKVVVH